MQNTSRASVSMVLILTGIFFGFLLVIGGERAVAQNTSDNASYDVTFQFWDLNHSATWPVAVKGLFIDGKAIPLDQPVHLEGQWLSKLTVEVQNVSPKTIIRAALLITFPEPGTDFPSNSVAGLQSTLGTFPDIALYHPDGTKAKATNNKYLSPVSFPPGALMTFTFALGGDDTLAEAVAKAGAISKATFAFAPMYFSDNTQWGAETYRIPSTPPGTWITVSRDKFFGIEKAPKQN